MNNDLIHVNTLTPFKRMCMTIGELPTSYLESMTYYEMLVWLCNYLEKTVIPTINNNSEAVEELQQKYVELKAYVDNYFENLDVQEEINNKLDDMAEAGTLEEIINSYLEINSVIAKDTVNDMINADNITKDSFIQTYGFNSLNDGGNKKYKIIEEQSASDVDGMTKINIGHDDLYAISINDVINVKQYGAYGDGTHDDQPIIQALIDKFKHRTIYFPEGVYLINNEIKIKAGNSNQVNLKLEENAIIKTSSELNALLEVGTITDSAYNRYSEGATVYIDGGIWNAEQCDYGIILNSNQQQTTIQNITIIKAPKTAIYLQKGINESGDFNIYNSSINCKGSEYDDTIGIYNNCFDNKFINNRINHCQIGVLDNGSCYCENIHVLWSNENSQSSITAEMFNKSIAFKITSSQSCSMLLNCFCDTMAKAFDVNSGGRLYINNFQQYYWFNIANSINKFLDYKGNASSRIYLNNIDIEIPANGTFTGLDVSSQNNNFKQFLPAFHTFSLSNINIRGSLTNLSNTDNIINRGLYSEDEITLHDYWTMFLTYNNYLPIAFLKDGAYALEIRNSNDQIIKAELVVGSTCKMEITNILDNLRAGFLHLSLCNYTSNSGDNVGGAYLCVRTSAQTANAIPYNVSIRNMKFGIQQVYTRRNYNNNAYLTNPTVNVEQSFNPTN